MKQVTVTQFGVRLPVAGPLSSPDAIRRVAVASESLGYDHIWLFDKIGWSRAADETHISCGSWEAVEEASEKAPPRFFESLTTLGYLAGVTSRIRLGVSVLVLPWREPILTAKQIANIDVLSGGRLILGIGVGGKRGPHNPEFELLGVNRRNKYARTRELLESMKVAWTERYPRFAGTFVSFDFRQAHAELNPKPIQQPHPPIWVGGAGPKSMAIAAELADGWIPLWLTPEDYKERIIEVRQLAEEADRDPAEVTIAGTFPVAIAPTEGEAWAIAARTVENIIGGFSDKLTVERVKDTALIGGPEEMVSRLGEYVSAGVEAYELRFIYHNVDQLLDQLSLFDEAVLPTFRESRVVQT